MEKRSFIPGSEWVYFKIYTGTKTADTILKNELCHYVNEMLRSDIINKWFFIRYSDPDFHIRLRLHLNEKRNFNFVFNSFFEMFLSIFNSGLVWKIQCDTYQREMERYGINTISTIENLFFIDSEYTIRILKQLDNENPEQQRWKFALIIVDNYLSAFELDLLQRKDFSNINAKNLKNEFGFTHHNATKKLNEKCRVYRKDIENTMLMKTVTSESIELAKSHIQTISPVIREIIVMGKSGELKVSINSLLSSLIHMSLDRLFRVKNRLQEMVIYEFLSRFYASEIAKNNIYLQNEITR